MTESTTDTEHVDEFVTVLDSVSKPATLDYLVDRTSVDSRSDAKAVLRDMLDRGMVKTSPGFRYQLAADVTRTDD